MQVKLRSEKEITAAEHEVDVLSLFSHRNIVGYYNNYVDNDVMYIEMEYANGGTLNQLILNQQNLFSEVTFYISSKFGETFLKGIE